MFFKIYFYNFFFLYRFVSFGSRFSSFVLDIDDGSLDISDVIKLLLFSGDKII